ncbi:hypothetical protein AB6A40_006270 [Gnathostoma spinigerum]|uniref:Protein kinase domain-containing protein n=1 Tax=Gnathostoma spinigerum TaxID=75299 RepID=A0ABD6EK07_9BILA
MDVYLKHIATAIKRTAARIAHQAMKGIEELHECGFISRDIKPGNFAFGKRYERNHHVLYIFDFGLARKYVDKDFHLLPSRGEMGWRGTTRYGSLHAHQRTDLSRRDDIESWVYMTVEITKGALPWRFVTDRNIAKEAKLEARRTQEKFFSECPSQYMNFLNIVDKLEFTSRPPYEEFYKQLETVMRHNRVCMRSHYDWETPAEASEQYVSSRGNVTENSPPKSHHAAAEGLDRPSHHEIDPS